MDGEHMSVPRRISVLAWLFAALALQACALLKGHDPLQVTIAGVEPLEGQGMELRMLVKLRVQNPNEDPIEYNGVSVEMDVEGKTFATGVSDMGGSVPRFGEAVITVPVTASAFHMLGEAFAMLRGGESGKISYVMKGKLSSSGLSSTHFEAKGDFDLAALAGAAGHTS
jgi:LEA14-like dessication related protein